MKKAKPFKNMRFKESKTNLRDNQDIELISSTICLIKYYDNLSSFSGVPLKSSRLNISHLKIHFIFYSDSNVRNIMSLIIRHSIRKKSYEKLYEKL